VVAADVEQISPELVLVCPELREQAIALLPDSTWQAFVAHARACTVPSAPNERAGLVRALLGEARGASAELVKLVPWALGTFFCTIFLTLALTLIADATR
jgi:hypothetical protein